MAICGTEACVRACVHAVMPPSKTKPTVYTCKNAIHATPRTAPNAQLAASLHHTPGP